MSMTSLNMGRLDLLLLAHRTHRYPSCPSHWLVSRALRPASPRETTWCMWDPPTRHLYLKRSARSLGDMPAGHLHTFFTCSKPWPKTATLTQYSGNEWIHSRGERRGEGDGGEEKAREGEEGLSVGQLGQVLSFLLLPLAVGAPNWGHPFWLGRLISTAKNRQRVNLTNASFWSNMHQKSCSVFFSIPNFLRVLLIFFF